MLRGFGKSATLQEIRQSAFERMQDRDLKLDLAEPVKSHDVFGGLKAHDIS